MRTVHLGLTSLAVLASLSACAAEPDVGLRADEVINGTRETGYPEVVAVYWSSSATEGGLCSGTVIGPYAILTAKHCVMREGASGWSAIRATDMIVIVGHDVNSMTGITSTHRVSEVRTTPGTDVDADIEAGRDIAVVLLAGPIPVAPRGYATSGPSGGDTVTFVGFGRTSASSDAAGVKYRGSARVSRLGGSLFETTGSSWTCQGDSGGPAIDPAGNVTGITSFGFGNCRISNSFFTRVSAHRALIMDALTFEPPCFASPEICDGIDNDCNGMVDEGRCSEIGEACASNDDCREGTCEGEGAARVCAAGCFPDDATEFCGPGTYCRATACGEGHCAPGSRGASVNGTVCTADTECASGTCMDLGGTRRCARHCFPGFTTCGAGEICELFEGECGGCIPEELSTAPRAFGERCDTDARCRSGSCSPDGFCTQACMAHEDCPGPYHCRAGTCVGGPPGDAGDFCITGDDCRSSAPECVDSACASPCGAGDACPAGLSCSDTSAGRRCTAPGLALGAACTAHDECRSGICATVCTQICDTTPCPTGFVCELAGGAMGCFRPGANPSTPRSSAGGSVRAQRGMSALVPGLALVWLALRRRRARRR